MAAARWQVLRKEPPANVLDVSVANQRSTSLLQEAMVG